MTDRGRLLRHFDAQAPGYDRFRDRGLLGWLRRAEARSVARMLAPEPGARVLDAGCGVGATLRWVETFGARAVGIDLSMGMLREARRRGAIVARQDLARPGFRPGSFDWVLCIGALEFVPDPGAALGALAECLRPQGRFVLLYPRAGLAGRLYRWYHARHGIRIRVFARRDVARLLGASGLVAEREERAGWLAAVVRARRPADVPSDPGAGSRSR